MIKEHPVFPVYDIDFYENLHANEEWDVIFGFFGTNLYYSKRSTFEKECAGLEVVDSEGDVFVISELKEFARWRRYIPFIATGEIIFFNKNEKLPLDWFKRMLISVLDNGSDDKTSMKYNQCLQQINSAQSYEDIWKISLV